MADEFIDFYDALNLPLEADRTQVRARIAEVYLEAQRNLDHRNFPTRVKYQELFEVILPRARYILLDDARRDEYNGLVRAFRGAPISAPAPTAPGPASVSPAPPASIEARDTSSDSLPGTPVFGRGDVSGFRLQEEPIAGGRAPRVEGLPAPNLTPEQLARERDEMLQKWRARLEAAIKRDEQEQSEAKPVASNPDAGQASMGQVSVPKPRAPRPATSFQFGDSSPEEQDEVAKQRQMAHALELQRAERKREAVKEILMGVGLKASLLGGMGAAFPLGGLLIFSMGHFYPRDAAPHIALSSSIAWSVGLAIVVTASATAAHRLSKELRQKKAFELATLPLEDILRQLGRSH